MSRLLALTALTLTANLLTAQDPGSVREIMVKLQRDFPKGRVAQPTVITNAEELAKAFPEADLQARLKKEVDFTKEKLVFFAWSGSGQDKLSAKVEKGPTVVFTYQAGLTRDLRSHHRLFAVPKDATVKVS